ncbi:MAG: histidinol dehydrogenase [Clostridiales bacterium]|jgi:histidinol dehydrogenase|nr:histidinol dehydrogenase [Clostridiales bacterium]
MSLNFDIQIIDGSSKSGLKAFERLIARSFEEQTEAAEAALAIIREVRERGDEALFSYTEKFDRAVVDEKTVKVTQKEIKEARKSANPEFIRILNRSIERVRDFHNRHKAEGWFEPFPGGELMGRIVRPLERVGAYVPGGKALYPSSVVMNVIPAVCAGVPEIIICTPPAPDGRVDPKVLAAADLCGVSAVYKAGGAQAVAAMAYGTKSIPRVDKIVGPGNIYVATAKRLVYGAVDIDSVAGPSEILIIADSSAKAKFAAADMLSQAEHDEMAGSVLITPSKKLAESVREALSSQLKKLPRRAIAQTALKNRGAIVITEDLSQAAELANLAAPEHLELCVEEPFDLLPAIKNAGAIFLGHFTPEPLGDYMAGPNHVLPTGGTARFFSPLSADDFVKKSSVLCFNRAAFAEIAADCARFAEEEGLQAHANAVYVRLKDKR